MDNIACQGHAETADTSKWGKKYADVTVIVDVREEGLGAKRLRTHHHYVWTGSVDTTIPCSNPYCRNGGVPLGPIVEELLRWSETEQLRMEVCSGRMSNGQDRSVLTKCHNLFRVQVVVAPISDHQHRHTKCA